MNIGRHIKSITMLVTCVKGEILLFLVRSQSSTTITTLFIYLFIFMKWCLLNEYAKNYEREVGVSASSCLDYWMTWQIRVGWEGGHGNLINGKQKAFWNPCHKLPIPLCGLRRKGFWNSATFCMRGINLARGFGEIWNDASPFCCGEDIFKLFWFQIEKLHPDALFSWHRNNNARSQLM